MAMKMTHMALAAAAIAAGMVGAPAFAADYPTEVGTKFGRGLANASTGWVELFKNTYNEPARNGALYVPVGLAKGIGHTVGRTVIGVFDLATFMIPTNSTAHPDYVWNNFNTESNYGGK